MDNDEVLCDLPPPPLSSIIPDIRRIGYDAASYLDRMMRGEPSPVPATAIPPLGVVTRRSTDVPAVDDRALSLAARFIREQRG